jgi:CMP-N,N'-diacetyllegionaminic acid synthase
MSNIAIIPARSGSKGLKNKNIKELNGKPLLAYSIEAAKESKLFDEIMVSTDSNKYAQIARNYGANVPFLRSETNSSDKASSWNVVLEVLQKYLETGIKFNSICLLQPTSPLRTAKDIIEAYKLLETKQADAITSVCEVDHSPLWTMTLPENLSLDEFKKRDSDTPRQLLEKYYRLNGAIYIRRINYNNSTISLNDTNEFAFIMQKEHSIDIDIELDFLIAETILLHQQKNNVKI